MFVDGIVSDFVCMLDQFRQSGDTLLVLILVEYCRGFFLEQRKNIVISGSFGLQFLKEKKNSYIHYSRGKSWEEKKNTLKPHSFFPTQVINILW